MTGADLTGTGPAIHFGGGGRRIIFSVDWGGVEHSSSSSDGGWSRGIEKESSLADGTGGSKQGYSIAKILSSGEYWEQGCGVTLSVF